jgi:hypothetical protein
MKQTNGLISDKRRCLRVGIGQPPGGLDRIIFSAFDNRSLYEFRRRD